MESRPYRDDRDHARILEFLQEMFAIAGPSVPMTVGDLEFWRHQSVAPERELDSARLWFEGDALVGFVWPEEGVLDMVVHPDHAPLADAMLAWGESTLSGTIETTALEDDESLQGVLRARGYERRTDWMHWYRVRQLDDPIGEPKAEVRSVDEDDLPDLLAGRTGRVIPLASYRMLRSRSPIYRAALDLIAKAPDGSVAASATVWFDQPNRTGLFEPVGCRPEFRRRGFASAVMREGLRRLRELGATQALVGCRGENEPANALYESLGFTPHGRNRTWRRDKHAR